MPSSCCQITRSTGLAPRPPYSFGQCRQTQPASAFFFCQALATSTMSWFFSLMRPSEDLDSSASNSFGAFASIHLRASARNAASCGVSSKFIGGLSSLQSEPNASAPSLGGNLVERDILVDPNVPGQPEYAFGDDVPHDLIGSAFDPRARRTQQHGLEFPRGFGVLRPAQHACGTLQIERIGRYILNHRTRDQLADRILRPRTVAFRERRDRAHAGVFQAAGAHRPIGELRAD